MRQFDLPRDLNPEHLSFAPPEVREHVEKVLEFLRYSPPEPIVEPPAIEPRRIEPLVDIALMIRMLTYGEMMELSAGLCSAPHNILRWAEANSPAVGPSGQAKRTRE